MPDYFALLGQPRRPWLDAEALKQRFLALSSQAHPDRVHDGTEPERLAAHQRFAELNAAHACLREPRDRLRHLLELELGAKPVELHEIPADLAGLFMKVAGACREVDQFLMEQAKVTSPLLRVQLFEPGQEWTGKLTALRNDIAGRYDQLLSKLKSVDADWTAAATNPAARSNSLQELETIYRLLGFFGRWSSQLQERVVRLAF